MKRGAFAMVAVLAALVPFVLAQQDRDAGTSGSSAGQSSAGQGSAGQSGQSDQAGQAGQSGQSGWYSQSGQAGQAGQGSKNIDQMFLTKSIKNDLFEQKLAQAVSDKVQDPSIKQFAQRLQDEHKQHLQQVRQVAQTKGITSTDEKLDAWQQQYIDHISRLDPESLQREFLFSQVASHYKAMLENKFAAEKCQDPQIKSLAEKSVPAMHQHFQQLTRLTQQVTGIDTTDMAVSGR
jgi:predicted outer membrane protein